MDFQEERTQTINKALLEYAQKNDMSAFYTSYYFVKQILHKENLFFKMKVIGDFKEAGVMRIYRF